jgi:phytoene synthase
MVPAKLRPHVAAIYAFARIADDIADEGYTGTDTPTASPEERIATLRKMDAQCVSAFENRPLDNSDPNAWIFPALGDTLRQFSIPPGLCQDLLSAFTQDVVKRRYANFDEVLDYCRRSANPVGRLVLLLHGYNDPERFAQSDAICTALQLANFWQDVAVDWKKDKRVYLPLDDLARFGVPLEAIGEGTASPALRECVRFNVDRAQALFDKGRPLAASLRFPLSLEIRVTWLGGTTILRKVRSQNYDTLQARPRINRGDKLRLLLRALFPL